MIKVNNKPVIKKLSAKSMKNSGKRNLVAVIAIALTTLLFTGLLTVIMSLNGQIQNQTMRQVGTCAHGGFKSLTREQYDKVASDNQIKDISYNIFLGSIANKEVGKINTEVRWSEEKCAQWGFTYPEEGTMPESRKDIACSTLILDALGADHKVGTPIELTLDIGGKKYTETFNLSGFWEGDIVNHAQTLLISKDYLDEISTVPTAEFGSSREASSLSGYISPSLWFKNAWDIDGKMEALKERCGFGKSVNEGVNWAYTTNSADKETIVLVISVLVLIVLSGYLIIYNIFAISVAKDVHFYGLLKTVGTTGKQLKAIVYRQAVRLSLIGIPIGLALGWLMGKIMSPMIMGITTYADDKFQAGTSASPVIFVGGILLTLATVWISCIKPCHMAAKVSAVEAVRWNESSVSVKKIRNKKRTAKVSPVKMAIANLKRSRGKTVVVVLSLTLSLILLNVVYTFASGFNMEKYLSDYSVTDFMLTDMSNVNAVDYVATDGVSKEDMDSVKAQEAVENAGAVYERDMALRVEGKAAERIAGAIEELKTYKDMIYIQSDIEMFEKEKKVHFQIYGADKFTASKITIYDGEFDHVKFATGHYIIAGTHHVGEDSEAPSEKVYYNIGDKVKVKWSEGNEKEYEVMAIGDVPAAASLKYSFNLSTDMILPAEEFLENAAYGGDSDIDPEGALKLLIDTKPGQEEAFGKWISAYCSGSDNLVCTSREEYIAQFKNMKNMMFGVGGSLAAVLGLISILNFVNATVTSIFTRRRELAMLQSVGMTSKQLKTMLTAEGLGYILMGLGLTVTLGAAATYFIAKVFESVMGFFTAHFTLLPVVICAPVLLIIAAAVPLIAYKTLCKETIVERLREGE